MNILTALHQRSTRLLGRIDFLAPLLIRLYLAPIFWMAGWSKLANFENTASWFGEGLGLPFPALMAALATATELGGALSLLVGLGVRLVTIPLMVTMLVAAFAVHWDNGWLAIAEGQGLFATERTMMATERLAAAREILRQHGDYAWLTEHGSITILNNGIEFPATYLLMLLSLLFTGAGRWVSVDHWIARGVARRGSPQVQAASGNLRNA